MIHTVPMRSRPATRCGAAGVLGPDGAGQAVDAVVGDRDRLVLVAERLDGEHRAERLVLGHRHRRSCSRRGRSAGSRSRRPGPGRRAARRRTAAPRPRRARGRRTPRPCRGARRWSAGRSRPCRRRARRAGSRSARATSASTKSSWIDSSTSSRAPAEQTWPECRKTAVSAIVEGDLEVGVGEDDVGVLAAELEGDLLHRRRGRGHDRAGRSRARR